MKKEIVKSQMNLLNKHRKDHEEEQIWLELCNSLEFHFQELDRNHQKIAMETDINALEKRYFSACKSQGISPNKAIVEALFKAKIKKARREISSLVIPLDDLKDVDAYSLVDMLEEIDTSDIDAVDMVNRSSCALNGEHVSVLLHAVRKKLRVVDINDISFGKEFLLNLAQRGLSCQVLNLRSSHFRKLNMVGKFLRMQTLNLDFSSSLTSFREDCFSCMPCLQYLSMCGTRISNLWTTTAALANIRSLVELRFQNCSYCSDIYNGDTGSDRVTLGHHVELPSSSHNILQDVELNTEDEDITGFNLSQDFRNSDEGSSDDNSEVDFSGNNPDFGPGVLPDIPLGWEEMADLENEIYLGMLDMREQDEDLFPHESRNLSNMSAIPPKNYICRHPSPICYEKHYRDYMIASLPNLKILDNLTVTNIDRERANQIFITHFEYLPYNRRKKESIMKLLQKRETRANIRSTVSQYYYSRSLCAAKMGFCPWPMLQTLSVTNNVSRDERGRFRPRQFEYHPSDSSLMVFGTLDGEVVVINHESEKIVGYIPSLGAMNSVLGLCWLKKYPSKLIAGSDNGSLRLYDITQYMPATSRGTCQNRGSVNFDEFDQLTSVHVNSTDELFLASGYSKHVALYDINTERRLQIFTDMHREHINVVKFSNHSPSLFATSSFDQDVKMWDLRQKPNRPCYTASSCRGNVMVCFSPDDRYLLVSAVDNEVKQLLAVDGRLHLDFGIASTGSSQNYTRSYYMNGSDYVISGSCDEHVVRICCAYTGRRLRDVSLEGKGSGASMFVQSLRGDPFRDFNMSVLAAYIRPSSNSEIVKVNLLASIDKDKSHSYTPEYHLINGMGG